MPDRLCFKHSITNADERTQSGTKVCAGIDTINRIVRIFSSQPGSAGQRIRGAFCVERTGGNGRSVLFPLHFRQLQKEPACER